MTHNKCETCKELVVAGLPIQTTRGSLKRQEVERLRALPVLTAAEAAPFFEHLDRLSELVQAQSHLLAIRADEIVALGGKLPAPIDAQDVHLR